MSNAFPSSGRRAFQFAAELAFPRLVGSRGETLARQLIIQKWKSLGLSVETAEFPASDFAINSAARWALVPSGSFLLIAAICFRAGYPLGSLLSALIAVGFTFFLAGEFKTAFARWDHRGKKFQTANIIASGTGLSATGLSGTGFQPVPTVIFMAHYDSKSQTFPLWLRLFCFLAGGFGGLALASLTALVSILDLAGIATALQNPLTWSALVVFLISAALLCNRVQNQSPGALDNAAGVAVITEIARELLAEPPAGLNLVFVATAAEELGLCGAKEFIKGHRQNAGATTYFINYDSPGYGSRALALSAYGIPRKKISPELNRALAEIAHAQAIPFRLVYLPVGAATDLFPVLHAGFQGVNLSSFNPRIHTPADTIETIREQALADNITLGLELARRLAEKHGPKPS